MYNTCGQQSVCLIEQNKTRFKLKWAFSSEKYDQIRNTSLTYTVLDKNKTSELLPMPLSKARIRLTAHI
jgi:hypothetical protein